MERNLLTLSIKLLDRNLYVAIAKKKFFGTVGIDSFAGPSEVLIIADENADPELIATDMFAQSEHDELAQAILIKK